METITTDLVDALTAAGYQHVDVEFVLAPAWTTDWIPEAAREKLRAYGIAPPGEVTAEQLVPLGPVVRRVSCPFCGSPNTSLTSEFGATACKSLHVCRACRQPFEHFKAF
jgi:ring-1,2-phenylacetyl-CoA epoxidase subunit PaaD